jgi:CheY-like chemotaxis protein
LTDLLLNRPQVYGSNLPATLLEDLEIVHRNCEHLAGMIEDVLNLSRAESGSLNLQRRWCDLRAMCDAAVCVVQPLIEKKELSLRVELPLDLPQVFMDETRIRQVIVNLLSNAARYTTAGEITLRAWADSNAVSISVADTGLGITPEELVKVFEPFYQGATAANRAQGGSGLGLSISKQLVELHDGELWVESTLGVGSTFFVSLPIGPRPVPVATPNRWLRDEWTWLDVRDRQPAPRLPLKPRLVVCDLGGGLSTVPAYRSDEVEIVAAESFAQAVTLALEFPSDALVLNSSNQTELLPLIEQAREQVVDTPIVGCVLPSFASQVLAAGANACLTKPITLGALEDVLHTARRSYQRILTVDDDRDFQVLLARMLGTFQPSAVVISAYDGEQALHELRRQRFDLVLLDIVMPRMTGWEVLARAQAMHLLDEVPVVVLSAQDAVEQQLASSLLVVAMGSRLTAATLLRCTLAISETLLTPQRTASG